MVNDARTEGIFLAARPRRLLCGLAMGKERPICFMFLPIPQADNDAGASARASIDDVAENIRKTATIWLEEQLPESMGWSVSSGN